MQTSCHFYTLHVADVASFGFLQDTNILPDIEIRIMLAPNTVLVSEARDQTKYEICDVNLTAESISFGDGSYRAMVDARMSTGEPLLVPFYNWAGFENSTGSTSWNQQFTIGTESLNALMGCLRPGNYDSLTLPQIGGNGATMGTVFAPGSPTANNSFYTPQQGDADTPVGYNNNIYMPQAAEQIKGQYGWYHTSLSGERPIRGGAGAYFNTAAAGKPVFTSRYQFNIDSKLYPQFMADVQDGWHLLRNMFDANALSLTYGSQIGGMDQFTQANWAFCVGLDHHADDAGKDHLISGLNTTGSLIPITYSGSFTTTGNWATNLIAMCGTSTRPTVFANMTSTLMIYQGRTITVVN